MAEGSEIKKEKEKSKIDCLNKKRAPNLLGALQQQNILTKH